MHRLHPAHEKALVDQFSASTEQFRNTGLQSNNVEISPQAIISKPRFAFITSALDEAVNVMMQLGATRRRTDATHWPGHKAPRLQSKIRVIKPA